MSPKYISLKIAEQVGMITVEKPIIATINAICLGDGLEIALCCGIRIATAHALFRPTRSGDRDHAR